MNWLVLQTMTQTVAQISVERILNALPEGILIALFAWALLRVLRRQNSGTRFAVWFLALLTIAALPVLGGFAGGRALLAVQGAWSNSWGNLRPAITIPGRWALIVFVAWTLGSAVAMARLAAGLWRVRQLRRSCTVIDVGDLDPVVRKTVEAIGASGSVTVATSECVRVPAALGFWKGTIVLPAWTLRELPPEDLKVILLHEFAHLRRGDDWTNLIQKIVRALFFFHPAVWWIESRLSVEREMACDDAVLAETANPHGYASCLVSLLEKSLAHRLANQGPAKQGPAKQGLDKRWSMAQAAVHRAREAALRLARILDSNRPVATRVWKPALGLVGVFFGVCLAVLPHAPQFVAFDGDRPDGVRNDRGMQARNFDYPYSAAIGRRGLQMAGAVPAGLRAGGASSGGMTAKATIGKVSVAKMTMAKMTTAKMTTAKVVPLHVLVVVHAKQDAGSEPIPAQAVATRLKEELPRDPAVAISARANQEIVPQFQTLVLIESTEYVASDSMVWSVQVWRVMWVSAIHEHLVRVPVADSI